MAGYQDFKEGGLWDRQLVKATALAIACAAVSLLLGYWIGSVWWAFALVLLCCSGLILAAYRWSVLRTWIGLRTIDIQKKLIASPELKGRLLGGFWLPLNLRLTCWIMLLLMLPFTVLYPLLWAPPTARALQLAALKAYADQKQKAGNDAPQTPADAVNNGNSYVDSDLAENTLSPPALGGQKPVLLPGPPPSNPPPSEPPSSNPSPTTGSTSAPTPTLQNIYIDVPNDWPGDKPQSAPITVTATSSRQAYVFNGIQWLPLPLNEISRLLGWGSSETRDTTLKVIQNIVEGQPLSNGDLNHLLKDVPLNGLDDFEDGLRDFIDKHAPDSAVKQTSLSNLKDVVNEKRVELAEADYEIKGFAEEIVKGITSNPPETPDAVVASLQSDLPQHKFLSSSIKRDVLLVVKKMLNDNPPDKRSAAYEKQINDTL